MEEFSLTLDGGGGSVTGELVQVSSRVPMVGRAFGRTIELQGVRPASPGNMELLVSGFSGDGGRVRASHRAVYLSGAVGCALDDLRDRIAAGCASPMNTEADRLIDQFRRAHDGDPWHGSPVRTILEGVTHTQAAARPAPDAHSIWELVLHMTGWRNEVARRARAGKPAAEPEDGDYPKIGEPSAARWLAALDALDAAHRNLVEVSRTTDDEQMRRPTNDPRNRPLGTGVTYYELLHGIVQHDAYHAGQTALLKKML